jgi:hypothetical protein
MSEQSAPSAPSAPVESMIDRIIQKDRSFRTEGSNEDLIPLGEVTPCVPNWICDRPTLYSTGKDKIKAVSTTSRFATNFYTMCPFLYGINMSNLFIAGGSVRDALLGNTNPKDIDVFVYGLDVQTATLRVNTFIRDIMRCVEMIRTGLHFPEMLSVLDNKIANLKNMDTKKVDTTKKTKKTKNTTDADYSDDLRRPSESEADWRRRLFKDLLDKCERPMRNVLYNIYISNSVKVIYNGHTLTISIYDANGYTVDIQLILRIYKTMSDIIHGFDLGSSAVGFDGKEVYFTSLSKFCYENMVNIYDGTRRSTTYEKRLVKYFEAGFSIVLPNLDISKLPVDYHQYNLPQVCKTEMLTFIYGKINGNLIYVSSFPVTGTNQNASDYENVVFESDTKYEVMYYNLSKLVKEEADKLVWSKIAKIKDRHTFELTFPRQVLNYQFIERFYEGIKSRLNAQEIYVSQIKKYFNDKYVNYEELLLNVFRLPKLERSTYIKSIIETQKDVVRSLLSTTCPALKWITENPGSQLTSSFNPIIDDDRKWYGEYYVDSPRDWSRFVHLGAYDAEPYPSSDGYMASVYIQDDDDDDDDAWPPYQENTQPKWSEGQDSQDDQDEDDDQDDDE